MSDIRKLFAEAAAAQDAGEFKAQPEKAAAFFAALATRAREEKDMALAADALDRALLLAPTHVDYLINRGTAARLLTGDDSAAIAWYGKALEQGPHYRALTLLSEVCFTSGALSTALAAGEQALLVREAEATRFFAGLKPPPVLLPPQAGVADRKNVIAFSLWGENPVYAQGALENVKLAPALYPGWICRIYCDDSILPAQREALARAGAEIVLKPRAPEGQFYRGLFWRFEVANDPGVGRFVVRDCDSRLNTQEAAAVREWLASGREFHLMRDHPAHVPLMMAGMWGGVAGRLPSFEHLMALAPLKLSDRYADQLLLDYMVWPLIREHVLIHDSYYRLFGASEFPKEGRLVRPNHIGAGHKQRGDL